MEQRARYLTAPVRTLTLGGVDYKCVFNNRAYCIAEDVMTEIFGKDIGISEIVGMVGKGKHSALMASVYGGISAGGADLTFEEFEKMVTFGDLMRMTGVMIAGIMASMPTDEDNEKNAETAAEDGLGRG